jgi:hypothetical protein
LISINIVLKQFKFINFLNYIILFQIEIFVE